MTVGGGGRGMPAAGGRAAGWYSWPRCTLPAAEPATVAWPPVIPFSRVTGEGWDGARRTVASAALLGGDDSEARD